MGWDEDRIRREIEQKQLIADSLRNNLSNQKPADRTTDQATINGLSQTITGLRSELNSRK